MDGKDQKLEVERFDPEATYDFTQFDCGVCTLNEYLTKNLAKEHERRISIPHLCVTQGEEGQPKRVVGYFTLASSSFEKKHISTKKDVNSLTAQFLAYYLAKSLYVSLFKGRV